MASLRNKLSRLRPGQRQSLGALAAALLIACAAWPGAIAAEPPVLTVVGGPEPAQFSAAEMRDLPTRLFRTTTIWTDGAHEFRGVPVKALLAAAKAEGSVVRAVGLDGYAIEIPAAALGDDAPIVAYELDGAEMPVRRMGPFWIVYPFDSDPAFRHEVFYARSLWHLTRIEVIEK